ncbi:MAG: peroxide stress protein YaaA [Proteobacteria bacterium]|nr:peroxide stress protein YaaA [Pseudomonadota bacterium]
MLILISPAKSLNYESGFSYSNFTTPHFSNETKELVTKLRKFSVLDLEKLMGVSKKLAELNHERFKKFSDKFTFQNSKQALLAFDGDVYKPIEVEKFSAADFDFAQKHLRILSGFYGILRPLDLMQPYRLEMGTSSLNLCKFWSEKISQYLDAQGAKQIINLASEEYFSAVNPKKISAKIINVIFKENKNGVYKIVGINAKKARGLMSNFIIKNKLTDAQELKNFKIENYKFEKEMSDEENFVFVR